jgi:predicted phage terminase large subunit-like protein
LTALERLDPVDRARLEQGDWYAEDEGAKFRREWFPIVRQDQLPESAYKHTVRYWDLAATEKTENNDPDWTAGALVSLVDGYLIIHDIQHFRANPKGVEERIAHTAQVDGPSVPVRMEQEPGATGKMTVDHYARYVLLGYDFDGHLAARTGKGKEGRINLWAGKAGRKEILLSQGNWIREFLDEAVAYGVTDGTHDDQLDAVSGAFEVLTNLGAPPRSKIQIII